MKLNELLSGMQLKEVRLKQRPFHTSEKYAIPGMHVYDYLNNGNNAYMAYRFGLALASNPDNDIIPRGPVGNCFTIIDYSDADEQIRKSAERNMGIKSIKKTNRASKEQPNTNKTSPVAKSKKNQYGV